MTVNDSGTQVFPLQRSMHEGLRLQVVVAHPDDETFGCGSLLLHAAGAGAVTAVCCATRGDAGEWPADLDLPPGGIAEQREHELRAAAVALGVGHVDVLDFADSGMAGEAPASSLVGAPTEAVADAVRRSVTAFAPDVLVTLDASDGHRDHARIRDLTLAVGAEVGVPVYLHCLPRRLMRQWAARLAEADPGSDYLALGELGTAEEEVSLVLDTSEHLSAREEAIRLHRSQTSPFEGLPPDLRHAFLTLEHLIGPVGPAVMAPARS
jgi:LmbE family N-acetylglucosaminyl deacetylase